MNEVAKLPRAPKRAGYVHTMTFFLHNRWSLHDKIGELLTRGYITQMSVVKVGPDWQLSWVEPVPPDVLKLASEVDPS